MKARSPLGEARRERIVALARDLIRCKSLSGEERDVADVVARAMTALGYDEVKADALGNVVGRLRPAAPSSEGALLFDSHMDTVAAAGYWTKDPLRRRGERWANLGTRRQRHEGRAGGQPVRGSIRPTRRAAAPRCAGVCQRQ